MDRLAEDDRRPIKCMLLITTILGMYTTMLVSYIDRYGSLFLACLEETY